MINSNSIRIFQIKKFMDGNKKEVITPLDQIEEAKSCKRIKLFSH